MNHGILVQAMSCLGENGKNVTEFHMTAGMYFDLMGDHEDFIPNSKPGDTIPGSVTTLNRDLIITQRGFRVGVLPSSFDLVIDMPHLVGEA